VLGRPWPLTGRGPVGNGERRSRRRWRRGRTRHLGRRRERCGSWLRGPLEAVLDAMTAVLVTPGCAMSRLAESLYGPIRRRVGAAPQLAEFARVRLGPGRSQNGTIAMATEESCLGSAPCDCSAERRSSSGPELAALGRARASAGDSGGGTLAAVVCLRRLDAHPDRCRTSRGCRTRPPTSARRRCRCARMRAGRGLTRTRSAASTRSGSPTWRAGRTLVSARSTRRTSGRPVAVSPPSTTLSVTRPRGLRDLPAHGRCAGDRVASRA
jgi:hypothetical protein